MSIEALVLAELKRRETFISSTGTFLDRDAASTRNLEAPALPPLPEGACNIPPEFISAPISAKIYKRIGNAYSSDAGIQALRNMPVTQAGIDEAREYVSTLLDVDLSAVSVEVIPMRYWQNGQAEGSHFRAGVDRHLICLPEFVVSPVEVLVHEFGHAAHTTRQRQNGEYAFYFTAGSSAELISHYCQYRYILDKLSADHFLIALGQLVTASYALSILASNCTDDFAEYLQSEEAVEISDAVPLPQLKNFYAQFQSDCHHFRDEFFRAISLILALLLIDDGEGMKRYASLDRIDQPLEQKLSTAFPNLDITTAFGGINERIAELLDRFKAKSG